ncbi:PREDICTED: DNA topoisomerase 2 isoform X2 [Dinoponera quadriceps]|uniref:DNA topoisomerase 2 n=1 Tax=Dinoponera quadriceps TaxID=609295 RepID=A0A6P3XYI6_DINQU|nr:PREDICTED: DNA topoisomerase 2 isoform X2 [Dinoponera quadriceps]
MRAISRHIFQSFRQNTASFALGLRNRATQQSRMSTAMENGGAGDRGQKQKTIEGIYQKKSQLEHILLRPDTYIGSVEPITEMMWVFDKEKEMMVQKDIKYVPGLYKIFDEILVNAADNKQRDPKMDMIKIDIDSENNTISVWNNGKGIPVVIHKEENMYVPTMIFGHLLTSSNYDDEEEKVTGGRNGYGAKLCNIFSHRFTVETATKEYKKSLKQTWGNNMGKASEPRIKEYHGEDFTKVTFSPDLSKFKMQSLDEDIVALMSRRAYDVAASSKGVKVYLNGTRVPVKNFKDYVDFYIKGKEDDAGNPLKIIYEHCNPRWEVAITLSDKGFQQMSFVNSIATTKGGRHVDHVTELIVKQLIETLKKKNKAGVTIKPFQIKNHLWVFINCLINNPTFDSQTKENMTLQAKSFGSKCAFTDKFITSVGKIGIVEAVLTWAKFKADSQLQKLGPKSKQRKLQGIPKLEDANDAGTGKSLECTLILTEGDSAKTMAVSGIASIGRDKYGIFPLRGKMLNVREATHKQILENAEINNLIKILGLQYKKKYETREDLKTLRYGKMMIMTDQDQDGSHIKGLLINFIHHNWPSLLKLNFIEEFITPIVKATKGSQQLSFFSLPEFEMWKKETENFHTYKIKYYKGLGTSTAKEAKEYFENMARHRIRFRYDGEQDDQNIIMAFSKKCVDQRKDWLMNHMNETKRRKEIGLGERYLYEKDTRAVSFSDFVNVELVLYSNYDNVRSIPNMIDGFKPGQRKVMFTCLKRNDKREVKVAQLAGSVAEHSAYHHGETSLMATIINLAQNFVGSNNINLLQPIGQFGTRLTGGKDAASPRYIFTMLSPLARYIFHKHDDALLRHEYDDNQKIEPVFYIPVIPMVLVNGADGIGTGWMTKIPNYNPREIIENLQRMMDGADPRPMSPYYKNFKGVVESCGDYRYVISGEISVIGPDKVEITELPIGTWTQTYKETVLEPMLHGTDKTPAVITDYKEYNTDTAVHFIVILNRDKLLELEKDGLHKAFKIQTTTTITSMCAFDENQCLNKYDSVMQIMKVFFKVRMDTYHKRKDYMEGVLQAEAAKLSNQARFILEKCDGTLVIENKKKKDMIAELVRRNYESDPVVAWKMSQNREQVLEEVAENDNENDNENAATASAMEKENFDYLLGMTMWTLTKEKKDDLLRQRDEKVAELKRLQARTPISLWKEDLDNLLNELDKLEEKERKEENKSKQAVKKPPQKFYKVEDTRRIIPVIDVELKKKIEKADIVSKDKKEGIKKPRGKKEPISPEEKDEFDTLADNAKTLDDRLGNSPEKMEKKAGKKGMKQTTLSFKPIKKESKKKDKHSDDSDDNIDFDSISDTPLPTRTTRRVTVKKNYTMSSEESSDSGEMFSLSDSEQTNKQKVLVLSDSDDNFKPAKKPPQPTPSSEELFDSLVGNSSPEKQTKPTITSSGEESPAKFTPPKKAPAKKKTENGGGKATKRQTKKKSKSSDSETDDLFSNKQIPSKKRKKKSDSEDDAATDDSPIPPPRKTAGRIRKPVSYAVKSDDSDSD